MTDMPLLSVTSHLPNPTISLKYQAQNELSIPEKHRSVGTEHSGVHTADGWKLQITDTTRDIKRCHTHTASPGKD